METRQGLPASPVLPVQAAPPRPPVPPAFPAPLRPPQPPVPPQLPQLSFLTDQQTRGGLPSTPIAPPLPPRLALNTHFPHHSPTQPQRVVGESDAPSALEQTEEDSELPTYEGLQAQEPGNPRFGRWRGWIEKRAQERLEERATVKVNGGGGSTSWDLPQEAGSPTVALAEGRDDRARDQKAEERLSRLADQYPAVNIANPDPPRASQWEAGPSSAVMSPSSSLGAGRGVHRLTRSTSILPLGSRFARGIVEEPRCGCVLPISTPAPGVGVERMDRFILVGTDEGLYLADLQPSLSSSTLRTAPALGDEASILPLWRGLGVLQLEAVVEPEVGPAGAGAAPKGIVVGLVKLESGDMELRMWNLASLSNLARWRVFNESSRTLDLGDSPSTSGKSNSSPDSKRSSKAYIKSLFTSSNDSKGKGKASASGSVATPTPLRQSLEQAEDGDGGFVILDKSHRRDGSSASSTNGRPDQSGSRILDHSRNASKTSIVAPSTSSSQYAPSPSSPTEHLTLPLEWANSSVRLPLPPAKHSHSHSAASPILFFQLSRTPPPLASPPAQERRDPIIRQRRSQRQKEREASERETIWLVVATRGVVYLYQSEGGKEKRAWKMAREFYAPAIPRQIALVRSRPPHSSTSPPAVGLHRRASSNRDAHPAEGDVRVPEDLALLLSMKDRSVLINLVDSSVQEVSPPSPALAPPSSSLAAPTDSSLQGRSRSTTATSTTSTASAASTKSAASSLTARVVGAASGKVASLVEGKQGIPAGMREKGMEEKLAKGRKVGEGGAATAREGGGAGGDWVGEDSFCLVSLSSARLGSSTTKQYHLLTRGSTTSIFPSPLPASSTQPLASFSFPLTSSSPLTHVQALLRTRTLSPQARERGLQHLVILAWTKSGVHVKEGLVDEGGRGRWWTPLTASDVEASAAGGEEGDEELEHQASLDFGRPVVKICEGGPWVPTAFGRPSGDSDDEEDDEDEERMSRWRKEVDEQEAGRRTRSGVFFFVRGVGDWGLRWIG